MISYTHNNDHLFIILCVNNKKNTLCTSSSYEFVFNAKNVSINTNNQHRLIQAARSA